MLLSIVECNNYELFQKEDVGCLAPEIKVFSLGNHRIEIVKAAPGPSAAQMRNAAARAANGRWIFFKDFDGRVDYQELLERVLEIDVKFPEGTIVGGRYLSQSQQPWQIAYHQIQRRWVLRGCLRSRSERLRQGQHLLGGALLVSQNIFKNLGGFCEQIGWGGEETDFVARHHRAGGTSYYTPRLHVTHDNQLDVFGYFKRAWVQNYNRGLFAIPSTEGHLSYWSRQKSIWPWLFAFFSVGWVAYRVGRIRAKTRVKYAV